MSTEQALAKGILVVRLDPETIEALRPSSGDRHFTGVVAPLLLAFTLPTIAVLATTEKLPAGFHEGWRRLVLGMLLAVTGFCSPGRKSVPARNSHQERFVLCSPTAGRGR